MWVRVVRAVARLLLGLVLGAAAGVFYGGLVGVARLGAYGRWGAAAVFVLVCTVVGALFGLLLGIAWLLSGDALRGEESRTSSAGGSWQSASARGTADAKGRGRCRQPACACRPAAVDARPVPPDRFAWLYRSFNLRN